MASHVVAGQLRPLWVNSGNRRRSTPGPLYLQQQKFAWFFATSAWCHKRSFPNFCLADELAYLGEQLTRAERFRHISIASGGLGLRLVSSKRVGGDGDYGNVGNHRISPDASRR